MFGTAFGSCTLVSTSQRDADKIVIRSLTRRSTVVMPRMALMMIGKKEITMAITTRVIMPVVPALLS